MADITKNILTRITDEVVKKGGGTSGLVKDYQNLNKLTKETVLTAKQKEQLDKKIDMASAATAKREGIQRKAQINAGIAQNKQYANEVKQLERNDKLRNKSTKEVKEQSKVVKKLGEDLSSFSVTLPILFGFQSISKGMESLIDPALQMFGVTEAYNEFLALKYMPTALEQLDQVLETGSAWLDTSEAERKAEGDMVLWTKRISEAVTYTAQWSQIMAAIGETIPLVGRSMGALAGTAFGLTTATAALTDEQGRLVATMSGFEAATGMGFASGLAGMLDKFGLLKEVTKEDNTNLADLKTKIEGLPTEKQIDIIINTVGAEKAEETLRKLGILPEVSYLETSQKSISNMPGLGERLQKGTTTNLTPSQIYANKAISSNAQSVGLSIPNLINSSPAISSLMGSNLINPLNIIKKLFGNISSRAVGGNIPNNGLYNLHEGERVLRSSENNSNQSVNITYNVTVSDKREFENMLKDYSRRMTEDIRRLSK